MSAGKKTRSAERGFHVSVRHMVRGDMNEVVAVEKAAFKNPLTQEEILAYLKKGCVATVAEANDEVVGYCVHQTVRDEIHVLNMAVHPRWRRLGVGSRLIDRLLKRYSAPDCSKYMEVSCVVPESNVVCQVFLRSRRFWCTDILKAFFTDTGEDGYLMSYTLPWD